MIENLFKNEEKSFKRALVSKNESDNKLFKMFNLIKNRRILDQDLIVKNLYGNLEKNSLEAYRKLCDRMINKLFNLLANFENFQMDKVEYSDYFFHKVLVSRNMYLFQAIKNKFIPSEWLIRHVQQSIKICDVYEFVEEGVIMERNHLFFQYTLGELEKCNLIKSKVEERVKHLLYLTNAEIYMFKYIEIVQHKSIDDKTKIAEIRKVIIELENNFFETKLQSLNYSCLMLKLQLAHYEEQFEEAEKHILEIIRISEFYPALKKRGGLIQNYMNLAYTQFYLYKFNEAYLSSLKAAEVYKDKDIILNMRREACVFALIYLNRFSEAETWLAKILSSGAMGNSPEQLSKRHLMMGVLKYLQGDYKGAFKHLQFTKEVESDREGWNLGIRMLNIYLTLSTEKVDLADQRINAMRKHIERTSKMRNLRKRDIIIFRILSHLSRSGFDFKETWEERKKDFALLRSKTPDCFWVPRSHELIIFDQWFEAKMNNMPYSPIFPKPKKATANPVDISLTVNA